jgi:hypothetical protein
VIEKFAFHFRNEIDGSFAHLAGSLLRVSVTEFGRPISGRALLPVPLRRLEDDDLGFVDLQRMAISVKTKF